jgi:glucose 1-dehydrogenase
MTEQSFVGQVAVVTGAGVGIGHEIATQLAQRGARVLLNDANFDLAQQAAAQIGGVCHPIGGDIADVDTVRGLVSEAVRLYGRLDMVVANAGITVYGDFFDYPVENFERVVNVNLRGTFFLAQAGARQMRAQGSGGSILLMSSVTGHQAVRYLAAYGMTKAALEMLAKTLVLELSPHRIRINAVAPGAIVTPRNLVDDPDYDANWGRVIPVGRAGRTSDIANAALFLLSSQSEFITGQTIVVDGGWTTTSPTPDMESIIKPK